MPAAFVLITVSIVASSPQDLRDWLPVGLFVVLTAYVIATAVRERVVLSGDEVRVVRLFAVDAFARADVSHVALPGGRGRPAHVRLLDGRPTGTRPLDLTGRPRLRWATGSVRLPWSMSARRLAHAIGAPLTTHAGAPATRPLPRVLLSELRTAEGRIRPLAYGYGVLVIVVIGLLTAVAVTSVG